jgi:hypothetical protein
MPDAMQNFNKFTLTGRANTRTGESTWSQVPVTSMDTKETEKRRKLNVRVARLYSVFYADGDDEKLLEIMDPDADFATLWGTVHGLTAIRVSIAEERRAGLRFIGPSGTAQTTASALSGASSRDGTLPPEAQGASQSFRQASPTVFERDGWMRRQRGGIRGMVESARYVKIRETVIVRDGRVVARVLQNVPKSVLFSILAT